MALALCVGLVSLASLGQGTQPLVAIHDSEWSRSLDSSNSPASGLTPTGPGTSGLQWWPTNWHYFVMPESIKEALRSDGTAFTVIGDSDIAGGSLLSNGAPRYPILISLAAEATRDDEIAALTNYVAAGGFLFLGSSSFTRTTNGVSRGNFAFAAELGLSQTVGALTNWGWNKSITKSIDHRLTRHIPSGTLVWDLPSSAEEISWGISPSHPVNSAHLVWKVTATDATVLASGDAYPWLTVKPFGKGWFVYLAPMQPLIGHGAWAPGMYAYRLFRNAIEWAFDAAQLPIPKLTPWPYAYDAAFLCRHDLENFTNLIAGIESSAAFEFTNGVKGDYYFCTGTVREDATNSDQIIAGLQRAVSNYSASIGSHNGGLKHPTNPNLVRGDYDYWHWGPDEALDSTPTNYPSGKAYALTSMSNSFADIETWLGNLTNGIRSWVACYFNATREDSYDIQDQIGIRTSGEQKLSPFPSWVLSTRTPNKRYANLSQPTSDWYVSTNVAQSPEPWHPPFTHTDSTLNDAVDAFYSLGALVNVYNHTLSQGVGAAGHLASQYILYSMNADAHPRLWSANAALIYGWWLQRSNAQVSASCSTNGAQSTLTFSVSGSTNPDTAVEAVVPASATATGLQVYTNGVLCDTNVYRLAGQAIRVRVGAAVTNVQILYTRAPRTQPDSYTTSPYLRLTVPAPGVLANDTPALGASLAARLATAPINGSLALRPDGSFDYTPAFGFIGRDSFSYVANDGVADSPPTQVALKVAATDLLFDDDFTRLTDPAPRSPWTVHSGAWNVVGGALKGGTNVSMGYGIACLTNSWTNYAAECNVRFPAGAYGGGLAGQVNTATGSRYAAWVYPGNSTGGSNVLRLLKFQDWTAYGYLGAAGLSIAQVNLGPVGTNWHKLKLAFQANRIAVYYDNTQVITAADAEAEPYTAGGIGLEFWTATTGYNAWFDDVAVSPLAANDYYGLGQANALVVSAPGVLGNDTPISTGSLTPALVTGVTNGTLNFGADGGFTYQPAPGFAGVDSFTYQAVDGTNNLGTARVIITVISTNHWPTLPFQANRAIDELTTLTVTNTASDPDMPGQRLSYQLLSPPAGAQIDTNGIISWTPTEAQGPGTYLLTTVVTDSGTPPLSATNAFTVVVNEVNRPPVLPSQPDRSITSGFTLIVTNSATDPDVPANPLTYALLQAPTNATISPGGVITWTPTPGQSQTTNVFVTVATDTNAWALANRQLSATNVFSVVVAGTPAIVLVSAGLISEGCFPTNGVMDPGETVTVGFELRNTGLGSSANLVATLLAGNGVTSPDGPRSYGSLVPGGPSVTQPFTFTASGACGGKVTAILQLQDGAASLGAVTSVFTLGSITAPLAENFDTVTAPALPGGWATAASGYASNWVTQTAVRDTVPNAAFCASAANVGVSELVSPVFALPAGSTQLSFRNYYDLEYNTAIPTNGYDGGVLEIKVGTNAFADILAAGGAFVSGGYNAVIDTGYQNPLAGRRAWSGSSGGFITSLVNLPASAAGQPVQFKWRCGFDNGNLRPGWRVDTVLVTGSACCFNSPPVLAGQGNRTIDELTQLSVTNAVLDPGIPAGPIMYSLLNPPAGASISSNGIIHWTPSEAQGPGTNAIITLAANSLYAALSATNSFTVVVREVNSPPVLPSLPNVTTEELSTTTITNTALDPDLPPDTLTYTLLAAPPGAQISATGIISWTPALGVAPSTNLVTTVVTDFNPWDSVNPRLSATNSFSIVVEPWSQGRPPIVIYSIQVQTNAATVTWSSVSGWVYRLQYKEQLQDPWSNAVSDITATASTTVATNIITGVTQRFYRVILP